MPIALAEAAALAQGIPSGQNDFFGVATILRSLILFNLLFAVQTVLTWPISGATRPCPPISATLHMRTGAPIPSSSRRYWRRVSFWPPCGPVGRPSNRG
jgi:hypothetical protein